MYICSYDVEHEGKGKEPFAVGFAELNHDAGDDALYIVKHVAGKLTAEEQQRKHDEQL